MIKAEHISIKRGIHKVVDDISWNIQDGEHWILFGLNGCGKTTLLSSLAGYYGTTQGTILINEKILNTETKINWRKKNGFVSASFFNNCYQKETVLDIVISGLNGHLGAPHQLNSHDVVAVKKLLTALGLKKKYQYPYDTLSSGQQQKVILARALLSHPQVLLLDEPFNGLDILGRMQVQTLLKQWKQQTALSSSICVTHHYEEITSFYTHAALMKNGKISLSGPIREVFTTENMCTFLETDVIVSWHNQQLAIDIPFKKEEMILWEK